MRILTSQYSLGTLSIDLYFAGCSGPHCANCHNPETHDPKGGSYATVDEIANYIKLKAIENPKLVQQVMYLGGEPLDQPLEQLVELSTVLREAGLTVWLFTRYNLNQIPVALKEVVDYIKTGRYVEDLAGDYLYEPANIYLSSSNQKIHKKGIDY